MTEAMSGTTSGESTGPALPKLDVGMDESTGGTTGEPTEGCRKVDFLFVIDNSGSMSDEQQNLIQLPGFIQTIQEELERRPGLPHHGVDTDAYVFAGCELICPLFFNMCPRAGDDYSAA
jgi:hypothetical protein